MIAFSAVLIAFLAAGPMNHSMRVYDAANEAKITAAVESVTEITRGTMAGIHLTIRTSDQAKDALLGPGKFLADKGFTFAAVPVRTRWPGIEMPSKSPALR